MNIVTLTGWGQPHDALAAVAPHARHIDYAAIPNVKQSLAHIAREAKDAHAVIGWSMGGQMALRALAEGLIAPQRLVLIATPYHFPRDDTYAHYRNNLVRNQKHTLRKSYALIAHNDVRAEDVKPHLGAAMARLPSHDWTYWLDTMAGYIPPSLSYIPKTLLVHGSADRVIAYIQTEALQKLLPDARLEPFEGSGHAPHWHDSQRLSTLIEEHLA